MEMVEKLDEAPAARCVICERDVGVNREGFPLAHSDRPEWDEIEEERCPGMRIVARQEPSNGD